MQQPGGEPGDIKFIGHAAIPSGWLACDGAAVSRTIYGNLFSKVGTTWGAGDGSTTFNLPDMRGRSPVGSGTGGGLSARSVGQMGGAELHALSAGEGGPHNHTVPKGMTSDPGPGYTAYAQIGVANPGTHWYHGDAQPNYMTSSFVGSGTPHNNMQPYAVCNFVIKT